MEVGVGGWGRVGVRLVRKLRLRLRLRARARVRVRVGVGARVRVKVRVRMEDEGGHLPALCQREGIEPRLLPPLEVSGEHEPRLVHVEAPSLAEQCQAR